MLDALMARFSSAVDPACLIAPAFGDRLAGDLAAAVVAPHAPAAFAASAEVDPAYWGSGGPEDWRSYYRPYTVVGGVLQIPVKGALLASCSIALGSYLTGYGYISRAFDRGMADANVRGIALMCDSYGGHVAECFDLADKIRAGRGRKPIRAFAHEHAYSAAYCLASAADKIVISRTGGVGSIGVVVAHRDVSAALAAAGVKITFVKFGAHKTDGNPTEPLSAGVLARMQARIDELGGVFVDTVAANRGLTPEAVKATEAATYTAGAAVEAGLADAIGSLEDAVSAFSADVNNPQPEDESMISQEAHDAAVAKATADGKAEGASTAYARIAAIAGDAKVTGRVGPAVEMAIASPGMPAADVVAFVEKHVPAASATPAGATGGQLGRLDASVPDPSVAATGGEGERPNATAGLSAAVKAAGGR